MSKKAMFIVPHGDDEVMTAGYMQQLKDRGYELHVHILCSKGFVNSIDDEDHMIQSTDRIKDYASKCSELLQYDSLTFGNMCDEQLDRDGTLEILKQTEPVYHNIKPDIIFTTHFGDNNQDHRAMFEAVQVMSRPNGPHCPESFFTFECVTSTEIAPKLGYNTFLPNYYIPITEQQLQKKQAALRCYKSEVRQYPNPRSDKGIEILARSRGMEIGCELAEAFQLIKYVGS